MSFTRCSRCLIPTTRPSTEFKDGLCSACIAFDKRKAIDWGKRAGEFFAALINAPKNSSGYDCIVASSGGKDSHWQVLKILELGFKPLVVTAQTCMLTDTGQRNIENLRRYADTVVYEYDPVVSKKLNVLGQDIVGDISWREHVAIFSAPFRVAANLGIGIVLYGENQNEAYGGPLGTEGEHRMTRRWITEHGGHLGMRASDMVGMAGITAEDMAPYQLPAEDVMSGITALFMGHYFEWDSHRNAEVAMSNGMKCELPSRANWWSFENQDCYLTGAHDFLGFLKYGYGRLCAQISVDIRNGRIGRDEALRKVRERDGVFPLAYMGKGILEILDELDVKPGWFLESCNRFMNRSLFVEDRLEWGQDLILREFAEPRMAAE